MTDLGLYAKQKNQKGTHTCSHGPYLVHLCFQQDGSTVFISMKIAGRLWTQEKMEPTHFQQERFGQTEELDRGARLLGFCKISTPHQNARTFFGLSIKILLITRFVMPASFKFGTTSDRINVHGSSLNSHQSDSRFSSCQNVR